MPADKVKLDPATEAAFERLEDLRVCSNCSDGSDVAALALIRRKLEEALAQAEVAGRLKRLHDENEQYEKDHEND